MKKCAQIVHTQEFINCFDKCKTLLINEPILQYPNFSKPLNLTTDASNVALCAALYQGPIGQDLPVAYTSRTLNECQENLSLIEKELLAIVWDTKYFLTYLIGRKFNIVCDHKLLKWLWSLKEPTSKVFRCDLNKSNLTMTSFIKKERLSPIEFSSQELTSRTDFCRQYVHTIST